MSLSELREIATKASLNLSNQDAIKVLAFIMGLQVGRELRLSEDAAPDK